MIRSAMALILGIRGVILLLAALNMILYFHYGVENIGAGVFLLFWSAVYYLYTARYKYYLWYIMSCVSVIVIAATYSIEILSRYNPVGLYEQFYLVYFATNLLVAFLFYAIRKKRLQGLPREVFGPDRLIKQFLIITPFFLGSPVLFFYTIAPRFYEFVPAAHLTARAAKVYLLIGDASLPSSFILVSFMFYLPSAALLFVFLRNASNYFESK
ncbi:hypothetical protein [Pseudovibrio sp. Tun.PSC04-5.I4]|uniref:hypothetical protein n=1 Tax=Pseudovibrio sp. Tun.PSC04-5.I4 TaxID=1798213 RepID=UPI000883D508|nr:hypothetical protein [Pseudovibrio sp. Tun.PSC04-5.I4]SDR45738.1 hypothetical protein SAMN04515695_5628 [Pseudovibrio sp. Tun.PSC04-5.I4]